MAVKVSCLKGEGRQGGYFWFGFLFVTRRLEGELAVLFWSYFSTSDIYDVRGLLSSYGALVYAELVRNLYNNLD